MSRSYRNCQLLLVGTAIALAGFLFVCRSWVVGYPWAWAWRTIAGLPQLVAGMYYDVLYVAALALVLQGALWLARKSVFGCRLVCGAFLLLALVSLGAAYGNVEFVRIVGRPFNYQWYYYSGFLKSADAKHAIGASLTPRTFVWALLAAAAMIGLGWAFSRGLRRWQGKPLVLGLTGFGVLYVPLAMWSVRQLPWPSGKLENPVVVFVGSAVFNSTPAFYTMQPNVSPEDFLAGMDRPAQSPLPPVSTATPIRNVLLFVLESVPAEFVQAYGGKHPVTPTLQRYRQHSRLFRRTYTTAPSTNKALVSLLCGLYPQVSYLSLTQENPGLPLDSVSSVLKANGHRTGFFSASDNTYQNVDKFLAHRSFDVVFDYRSRACDRGTFVDPNWNRDFLNGVDDECATDALIEWLNAEPAKPFFALQWTMMTHYPYFVTKPETDFGVGDPYLNRYLNALRHGDACLGKILAALEAKGLADSTLVVVVGDHGEAFGRHGQYTHASCLYEENVRVPLLLINRQLFHGEEDARLTNLTDIAPTILHVLGQPAPAGWQGQSLLGPAQRERVYFFATWSEYLFGYVEAGRKCLYNASQNRFEIYDLARDPLETRNLAGHETATAKVISHRLASWVQYQDRLLKRLGSRGHR